MDKIGVFLTGGGGKGSYLIGFFRALEELNIKPDVICGSSIGALVGAAATYLDSYSMYECWKTLTLESVLKVDSKQIECINGKKRTFMLWKETFLSCFNKRILIDIDDIRKLLYNSLDGDKIRKSTVDFGLTVTQLPNFKMLKLYKEDMNKANILEYVLASLYLPIFAPQKIIDNKYYLDIATIRRYPFEMLKEKECSKIFIVDIGDCPSFKAINTAKSIFNDNYDITMINMQNKPSLLDFSLSQARKNYENGYEEAVKVLTKKDHYVN